MKRAHLVTMSAVVAIAASISCAKKEPPAGDTTVAVSSAATSPAPATPMTRTFGAPQPHQLLAEDDTPITVDTEVLTNAIIVNKATPPSQDTLIGKILNTSQKKEKRYKFKPQDQAEYYLYAKAALVSGSTGWYINEKKKNDQEKLFLSGSFGPCDPTHPVTVANLGFKSCPGLAKKGGKAKVKTSSMFSSESFGSLFTRVLAFFHVPAALNALGGGSDDPAWVACTDGCCTLGNNSVNPY